MLSLFYKDILKTGFTLTPSRLTILEVKNKNVFTFESLLDRKLKATDKGTEVGSINYISNSKWYFIKAKALQEECFLPEVNKETTSPIRPQVFKDYNLKAGDILMSKDSNIGEVVILDKDYYNYSISGALYKLPITKHKYYLFAFLKHSYFRKQLDLLVPRAATIRHAKTLFLNCKIPFPTQKNANIIIEYIELLTQAIINKEKEIRRKNSLIFNLIEKELLENQRNKIFEYKEPKLEEIIKEKRLDTGLYTMDFKKISHLIDNYKNGYFYIDPKHIKGGNTPKKRIIGTKNTLKFQWITPTNINDFGTLINNAKINCPKNNLKKDSLLIINRTSRGGGGMFVGMTMFYDVNLYGNGQYNQGLYCVQNYDNTKLCFMGLFLNSSMMRKYCANLSLGAKMKELKLEQILKIPFPNFPDEKQKDIVSLYHNSLPYNIKVNKVHNFLEQDYDWNNEAGIIELDISIKNFKQKLNDILDKIVNDEIIDIGL